MQPQRILVTGASGLLGSAVAACLQRSAAILPLAHAHPAPGLTPLDLADPREAARLEREPWDALVHCAAYRSPEFCEDHKEAAWRLNAETPEFLARLACRRGARMVHISTDYVFPGTHPPYREGDACEPVNDYGRTKLAGEQGVSRAYPAAVILRIGALYGRLAGAARSPMLEEAVQAVREAREMESDDCVRRYPLFVEDVAKVVRFLLFENAFSGVLHAGASQGMTRYGWMQRVAAVLGVKAAHIKPSVRSLYRSPRPVDAGLCTDRLRELGGPVPRNCDEVLPDVLAERRMQTNQNGA